MPMTLGVHEDADPPDTAQRFPGARIGREFIAGKGPDKTLDVMRPDELVTMVRRATAGYLGTGWRVVVSFKPRPADVAAGKWDVALTALGASLAGLDVEIVPWHEPEDDLTADVFAPYFAHVRAKLKQANPALVVAYCAMAYQWGARHLDATHQKLWAEVQADRYYLDVYFGKSFRSDLTLPEHPGVARWLTKVIGKHPGREWGFLEYGRAADPNRPAMIAKDFEWLATDPVGRTCTLFNVWGTGGTENNPAWLLDDKAVAAVAAGFARLRTPAMPAGYEPGPAAGTLTHTTTGALVDARRATEYTRWLTRTTR